MEIESSQDERKLFKKNLNMPDDFVFQDFGTRKKKIKNDKHELLKGQQSISTFFIKK